MMLSRTKFFGNLRNLERCKKFCVVVQSERTWTSSRKSQFYKRTKNQIPEEIRWAHFHTSSVCNKIISFKLSDIGEGIREVAIKEWFVKEGDKVQQFDNICEVQSDKASVTITSRYDGVITKLYHKVDQIALVGQPLVDIEVEDSAEGEASVEKSEPQTKADNSNKSNENTSNQRAKVMTTPSVRRIASQFKIDLSTVKATGKNGRLIKEDLLAHLGITSDKSNEVPDLTKEVPSTEARVKREVILEDKVVPISGFTKAMIKSMTAALAIPHFVFSDEYNVTNLVEARATMKELANKHGVKLTYMPIILKAASLSLKEHPVLNSSLDERCENVIYKASHNIGVAMDTPHGLVVPVIKNVQSKNILEIARELNALQGKGAKSQLGLSDLTGGTFTISNIGIVGGTYCKPVIFPPQVSIGALGKIQVLPRFDSEGNVIKAHILTASWSADHRLVDGVTMAKFSTKLQECLENPYAMLLEM